MTIFSLGVVNLCVQLRYLTWIRQKVSDPYNSVAVPPHFYAAPAPDNIFFLSGSCSYATTVGGLEIETSPKRKPTEIEIYIFEF
jgi:hypothetical protein